ncbi:MAG: sce7726 family protein [Candidatus Sulfotelmatobacter sp.]
MRDIDIRRRLRVDERLHPCDPDTRIVEELGLCQGVARVDLAVVNGTIHGYEIKSERDTLTRLPGQAEIYNRVLDYVTVVTAPMHADNVRKAVPEWWGVWAVVSDNGEVRLEELRESGRNSEVNPFALAQLLWRDEALQVLIDRDLAVGMRSKSRKEIWQRLASELTLEEIGSTVRACVKSRGADWRVVLQQE